MRTRTSSALLPRLSSQPLKRVWPLATIVLLHAGIFYALQQSLLRHSAPASRTAVPREVFATFITPEPAAEARKPQAAPPKPQPAPPKPAPAPKKPAEKAAPKPVERPAPLPADKAPVPKSVSTPPTTAPAPAEPVAPAASAAPAPASAAPAVPAQPRVFSSGIEYIQPPQPDYPPMARRMGEEGRAVLRVLVNEKGRPEQVEVQQSSGSARLDEAARQAAMRALFKPFIENGRPIAAYAIVPIRFKLNN
ncbi:energy transducer TonB [Noviherbaspirillum massiliense]|uniref:energy transducer TonB n=1 Tax=Noviherbaspirillum massiliense TaxID=1465823 RepID=UPI0003096D68|nr:energy transducer TonB [Noviherbaspirillum massiliense]